MVSQPLKNKFCGWAKTKAICKAISSGTSLSSKQDTRYSMILLNFNSLNKKVECDKKLSLARKKLNY